MTVSENVTAIILESMSKEKDATDGLALSPVYWDTAWALVLEMDTTLLLYGSDTINAVTVTNVVREEVASSVFAVTLLKSRSLKLNCNAVKYDVFVFKHPASLL